MKKLIALLLFAITAVSTEAGIAKKSAKAAEVTLQAVEHGAIKGAKKAGTVTAHAVKKAGHVAKKVLY